MKEISPRVLRMNTLKGSLLIMDLSVLRAILPERVLGSLSMITACLKAATGPIDLRTTA